LLQVKQQGHRRRHRDHRQAGAEPEREHFRRHPQRSRLPRQEKLLQGSIDVVLGEQAMQRQQAGEQRRHPQHAGGDRTQLVGLGTDPERKQADHDDEEGERDQHVGAATPGEQ